ncbi:MAG: TIR domain-containing protein [Cytophagales bacterium]|nr:TIR domain-containing protein [Cytophagales bacterium]
MGKKIFVSYKYGDKAVQNLTSTPYGITTTARHYVDELQRTLGYGDNIYKGENDNESLDSLKDSTIGSKLGDKIFDSTVTVVLISKNMKETYRPEKEQWIPWEISYSLKEQSRQGQRSKTNAILAVVLPETQGSYDYLIEDETCPSCHSRTIKTGTLFQILRENMFNVIKPQFMQCERHIGGKAFSGHSSFIHLVKWKDFIINIDDQIGIALDLRARMNEFNIVKSVKG